MSASPSELQIPADAILTLLGVRMNSGQIVIHLTDGLVQKIETNVVYHSKPRDYARKHREQREG